ncbi:MAG: Omp28-related outer membrane protein [Schleiferiaceae bacterium]|nr:Omp28-related outer membrane protein [Schleiferiaceae bacterium]
MRKLLIAFMSFATLASIGQTKRVLLEELTGTWCQWCPGGTVYADSLSKSGNVLTVAIHTGDPMAHPTYNTSSGLTAAPSANVDRGNQGAGINSWFSLTNSALAQTPKADIDVFTTFNPQTRLLTARVKATFGSSANGTYKLAAIITEDNVVGPSPSYDQSNSYSGGSNGAMGGFETLPSPVTANAIAFNHVGRELLGTYNGVSGSVPNMVNAGDTASYTFTHTLPNDWNHENIRVIGYLINPSNQVDNVNKSAYLDGESNGKPVFTSPPIIQANVNSAYTFNVFAADPDDKNLSFSGITLPSWLSLSPAGNVGYVHSKAVLSGTPSAAGTYPVSLMVSDGNRTDTLDFSITVGQSFPGQWILEGNAEFASTSSNMGVAATTNGTLYAMISNNGTIQVYEKPNNGTWAQAGALNGSGSHGRIRLGNDGLTPYVAYSDGNNGVTVKKFESGTWTTISTLSSSGVQIGFDLGANDQPYVAMQDGSDGYRGNCYTYDGQSWVKVGGQAYSGTAAGVWNDLKIHNSTGDVYVLWNDFSGGRIANVSKWDGNSWTLVGGGPLSNDEVMFDQNLEIDQGSGHLYVVNRVRLAGSDAINAYKFNGNQWNNIGTNVSNGVAEDVVMTMNDHGSILVAFTDFNAAQSASAISYQNGTWAPIGPSGFSGNAAKNLQITSLWNKPFVMFEEPSGKSTVRSYTDPVVSIKEFSVINTLSVYPNPTSSILNLKDVEMGAVVKVFDLSGRLKAQVIVPESLQIDLSRLQKGFYLLSADDKTIKIEIL